MPQIYIEEVIVIAVQFEKTGVVNASGEGVNPNLLTSNPCYGGNRWTSLGNGVKVDWTSNAGDTYWYLRLASGVTLTQGDTYTFSCKCSGIGSASVMFRWSNLAGYEVYLQNGWNYYTFAMPSTNITNPFFDDINRDTTLSDLRIWDFKLEEGSVATPWCPNESDPEYVGSALGFTELETIPSIGKAGYVQATEFIEW